MFGYNASKNQCRIQINQNQKIEFLQPLVSFNKYRNPPYKQGIVYNEIEPNQNDTSLSLTMYDYQNNKQTFFQPQFQELLTLRKQSQYSICEWNLSAGDKIHQDLHLVIEDVINSEINDSHSCKQLPLKDELELFQNDDSLDLCLKSNTQRLQQNPQTDISQKLVEAKLPNKKKKITKNTKNVKPIKHKLTLKKVCYQKNICRNIIRKAIRAIQCEVYKRQIQLLCDNDCELYLSFQKQLVNNVQTITGPRALAFFLQPQDDIANIFRRFLVWYLKQKYLREALQSGLMDNIQKYIIYKNEVLLPLLGTTH